MANTDQSYRNPQPAGTMQDRTYTPPRDARMPITVVPAVVSVGNLPQGIQQTGATNSPNGGRRTS